MSGLIAAMDEQIFVTQARGGISRCFVELARALQQVEDLVLELPFNFVVNDHIAATELFGVRRLRGPRRLTSPLARQLNGFLRAGEPPSVIHHTYYDASYLLKYPGAKRVSTIHDMIPETHPEWAAPSAHLAKHRYVQESDVVICVSEATRAALHLTYGSIPIPVVVVPHGVGEVFFLPGPRPPELNCDYLLYVGERRGYKGFDDLIAAVAILPQDLRRVHVVAVGGGRLSARERQTILQLGLRGRVHQFSVPDHQLPSLYGSALLFVSPSLVEGFGLPVLEAMASGCRLLLSDIEAYRELAGDTAAWFTPGDAEALSSALDAAVRRPDIGRAERVARARTYTWESTARGAAKAYGLAGLQ
jgi:glycosyltransferase involved in cell wall biosynthesis